MSKIQFRNAAHRDFVLENLDKCKVNDCYHRAFFYVMGISEETRMNIGKMFDFKRDCIIPMARISPKIKSDRLLTTVSGSFAANAVVVIPSANAPTMTIVQ